MKSILFTILLSLGALSALGSEFDEMILEVSTINGITTSDPIIALCKNSQIYLPLLDVGRILGIQIDQPKVSIFKIYKTPTDFELLDLSKCPKEVDNECAAMIDMKGTHYINAKYLKEKFQWPISVDIRSMILSVDTGTKINNTVDKKSDEQRSYEIVRKQFAYPAVRAEATGSTENKSNTANIYESQPLFKQDSDMLISSSPMQTHIKWTLSKEIVEPTEFYDIKNYEFISTQTLDEKYLFSPTQILGFNISNINTGENILDTQNLYDKGPPRWKVDLFINEIYFGETVVDKNGNFSFTNIPIFYGPNRIQYKLTSPIGKTIELNKILNISTDFQGVGKLKYQAAFGQVVDSSSYIGSGVLNYGVTSNVSAQAGLAQIVLPSSTSSKRYLLAGISYFRPNFTIGVQEINTFNNSEHAWVLSPKLNLGPMSLTGEYASFDNLKTAVINSHYGDDITSLKKTSLISSSTGNYPTILQLTFQESTYKNTESTQQLQARLYSMLTSNSILIETNKFWPSTASPDLYIEYGNYNREFRGRYGVQIQNDKFSNAKIELEHLMSNELYFTTSANLSSSLKEGSYAVGVSKIIGNIQTEINLIYSEIQITLYLTFSTNIKTNRHELKFSQNESYRMANIEIFAFVDENSNGKYDHGERPYPRLRILEKQRQKDYLTDDNGVTLIPSLNPYRRVELHIVKESIPNIFLTAQDFERDFILTPGQQLKLELPIKPCFDIRGTVNNSYFKKLIPLDILDTQNNIIGTVTTTSLGKYKFTDLSGGTYLIRIKKEFLETNKLISSPETIVINLSGKAGVHSVEEFNLYNK